MESINISAIESHQALNRQKTFVIHKFARRYEVWCDKNGPFLFSLAFNVFTEHAHLKESRYKVE